MPPPDDVTLKSYTLGALPIVQHYLERLRIEAALDEFVATDDRRVTVPYAKSLGLLVRNLALGREPVYAIGEWARRHDPGFLGFGDSMAMRDRAWDSTDDNRLGRALDRLFDADRGSLLTTIIVRAIREFEVELECFHNDSTSITFSGQYMGATGRRIRGKKAAAIVHGHNKDHRPDLKQLLWILTVSADGAVPIHYRVTDGNTSDDPTHVETWKTLRQLVDRADFLYVADCKFTSRENMDYVTREGGRFISVLPRSRKEDGWFREYILSNTLPWEEAIRRPNPRRRTGEEDVWRTVDAPLPSAEGYRIVWAWSSLLAAKHANFRLGALRKALQGLEDLNERLASRRCRLRERTAVEQAVASAIRAAGADRWATAEVVDISEETFKQATRGRPGANTEYVRHVRPRFRVEWRPKADIIANDAKSDGMFPLITNDNALSGADVLAHYKDQPYLEKRHEQLKTIHAVTPVFLKNEGRVEALLFLYFVALLIQALVEREVRRRMDADGIEMIPIYPEERDCRAPTAARVFDLFAPVQRHEMCVAGQVVRRFPPELTPVQKEVLRLAGVPKSLYA